MIKLFTDTADYDSIKRAALDQTITGFTTNPTLMKQAGITDYESFSRLVIAHLARTRPDTCLSLEVFADDHDEMYRQATIISNWGTQENYPVYVKIPIMNTKGEYNYGLIKELVLYGVKVNVTALFTYEQVTKTIDVLNRNVPAILSVFAGRIADAGVDPTTIISDSIDYLTTTGPKNNKEFLWASSREAYNYRQAEQCGCDIITMTPDLIKKVKGFGKDLHQFSLETVQMFYNDATASGFKL
jgi:transaldolase